MSLEEEKTQKTRTSKQNRSLHRGCQEIADTLVEHGISLNVAIKNLDVRPTMHTIKDAYRSVAKAKFGVDSTTELTTTQISEVWNDLTKAIEENTGVSLFFPSNESKSLEEYYE